MDAAVANCPFHTPGGSTSAMHKDPHPAGARSNEMANTLPNARASAFTGEILLLTSMPDSTRPYSFVTAHRDWPSQNVGWRLAQGHIQLEMGAIIRNDGFEVGVAASAKKAQAV